MARGAPRLWGIVLGVPTIVAGAAIALNSGPDLPAVFGYPFVGSGLLAILLGAYVERVSPEKMDAERVRVFKPSQLPAYFLAAVSAPFFLLTIYLLFGTRVPYVYPTLSLAAFVVIFAKALVRYWQNSLTTYYITPDSIISEYRFLALDRVGANTDAIENVVRRQSVTETLTGLGSVTVRSPSGNVSFRDLDEPAEAEKILNAIARNGKASVSRDGASHGQ